MTSPNEPDTPAAATPAASNDQTDQQPTTPIPAEAAAPVPVPPAPQVAADPKVVPVPRTWLVAGSVVGALAVVGLAFGAGFVVGDHTDRGGHHPRDRGEMSAPFGDFGDQGGPGRQRGGPHMFILPEAPGAPRPGDQDGQQGQDQQSPTPSTGTPS